MGTLEARSGTTGEGNAHVTSRFREARRGRGVAGAVRAGLMALSALAAGAILTMVADTMIPEAFEQAHDAAGLITVAGFYAAFVLSKWGG